MGLFNEPSYEAGSFSHHCNLHRFLQPEVLRLQPWVLSQGNKASKPLTVTPVGVAVVGETPSLTGEFIGETHRVLEHTQTTHLGISTRRA